MKSLIIKAMLWIVGGSVVFVGSLFGFLAIQGRTSAKELSQLPILSMFIAAPPESNEPAPAEGEFEGAETAGGGTVGPTGTASPTSESGKVAAGTSKTTTGPGAVTASLPPRPKPNQMLRGARTDSTPFTGTELERMASELRQALQATVQRERALDERERTLERIGKDLEERRSQLDRMLLQLENEAANTRDERDRFQGEIVLLESAEKQNLRKLADKYQVMKAEEAAVVLSELEFDDIVKIISQMSNDRQVGKILGSMNPQLAASVTEKLMKLIDKSQTDGQGKK